MTRVAGSVSDSSALWVLAVGADGVKDGYYQAWVARNNLVVHEPHVDHATLWVRVVEWGLAQCAQALKRQCSSGFGV